MPKALLSTESTIHHPTVYHTPAAPCAHLPCAGFVYTCVASDREVVSSDCARAFWSHVQRMRQRMRLRHRAPPRSRTAFALAGRLGYWLLEPHANATSKCEAASSHIAVAAARSPPLSSVSWARTSSSRTPGLMCASVCPGFAAIAAR